MEIGRLEISKESTIEDLKLMILTLPAVRSEYIVENNLNSCDSIHFGISSSSLYTFLVEAAGSQYHAEVAIVYCYTHSHLLYLIIDV